MWSNVKSDKVKVKMWIFDVCKIFLTLPEWLEEFHKLNKAHRAIRDHEVLETSETAFTSTVPWPAAPCPETHN